MDTWTSIEHGRTTLGHYLAGLAEEDWQRPSLCSGWTVKDVAAHLLVVPTVPKGRVFRSFLGSGFNLDKMNAAFVKKLTSELSNADVAAAMTRSAASQTMPPGLKPPGVLTELAVHSLDISEALGNPCPLPAETFIAALDHLKNTQPVFGTKKRIAGLTLRATDAAWSWGSGPLVEGQLRPLLLALAGRPVAFDHLTGDGLGTFRSR